VKGFGGGCFAQEGGKAREKPDKGNSLRSGRVSREPILTQPSLIRGKKPQKGKDSGQDFSKRSVNRAIWDPKEPGKKGKKISRRRHEC